MRFEPWNSGTLLSARTQKVRLSQIFFKLGSYSSNDNFSSHFSRKNLHLRLKVGINRGNFDRSFCRNRSSSNSFELSFHTSTKCSIGHVSFSCSFCFELSFSHTSKSSRSRSSFSKNIDCCLELSLSSTSLSGSFGYNRSSCFSNFCIDRGNSNSFELSFHVSNRRRIGHVSFSCSFCLGLSINSTSLSKNRISNRRELSSSHSNNKKVHVTHDFQTSLVKCDRSPKVSSDEL